MYQLKQIFVYTNQNCHIEMMFKTKKAASQELYITSFNICLSKVSSVISSHDENLSTSAVNVLWKNLNYANSNLIHVMLIETMFMWYKNKRRRKEKQLETRLQREHM